MPSISQAKMREKRPDVPLPKGFRPADVKVVWYPTENLKPNPLQPVTRTAEKPLRRLAQTIVDSGVIVPLAVVAHPDNTATIGDGHRRWGAGKLLGLQKLPCIVVANGHAGSLSRENAAMKTLVTQNSENLNFRGKTWLEIYRLASDQSQPEKVRDMIAKRISPYMADRIKRLTEALGGQREFDRVSDKIKSPNVIDWIERLAVILRDRKMSYDLQRLAHWVVNGNMKPLDIKYVGAGNGQRGRQELNRLYTAFMADKPFALNR